ncbi:hypothetical protein ASPVEDRAFT_886360 [Aspergillus versicolor CBS 583.65]|uniref:Secreted protein CSS2 C-terminal domain-containing protein n=1 Tax=Aspergillus versicolor CBS 583.65 TaxID=1036611 RepID=A0A1L9PIH1_ASPVE|nr:uncharacterized protein ASPVEDRAFT_886360 [Aspergillus versicolor CBS 583.65]OJJ01308.1 hypothetical protein ASPVEDRAFT_886360 [Aspergillus versicolor CBS 583.65]
MRFLQPLLIALSCYSTSTQASTWPSSIQGQPAPDRWLQISLNETGPAHALMERTPVTVCERVIMTASACSVLINFVKPMVMSLAGTIKGLSDQGSCNSMHGTYETLSWMYHSSGRNCDTTAQHATIAGAIKKYLEEVNGNRLCSTECLRMDHGGTWDGWLKIGPTKNFNKDAYCGPSLTFSNCLSGGNNDI